MTATPESVAAGAAAGENADALPAPPRLPVRSVRTKLFAGVLVTSLVALLVMSITLAVYDLRSNRAMRINDLDTQAELIGRASVPALQFDDPDLARHNLALLQVRPAIEAAALYDARGELYAQYRRHAGALGQPLPVRPSAAATTEVSGENIVVQRRFYQNGELIGSIYLQGRYELYERLRNYTGILLLVSALALLVSLLLSRWLQATITRPIIAVTDLARRVVERRDYTLRAERTTDDEIGYMVDAFNQMLSEVERRTDAQQAALRDSESERERTLFISRHDSLTKLPNRSMFHRTLQEAVQEAERDGRSVQVLFLDVDRFKEINDSLGHYVGDVLLTAVADRLRECVGTAGTVARLSGDEFGVLCRDHPDVDRLAAGLVEAMSRPFDIEGHHVIASTSVGITSFPADTRQPDQLLMNADMAMYAAKTAGRSTFRRYTGDLEHAARRRQVIKSSLREALANDELVVHYQPVVGLADNLLRSVEALVRWPRQDIPLLTTTELVAVAEDGGLIVEMGEWMLRTVCREAKSWQERHDRFIKVAVNISSRQLKDAGFIALIDDILRETGLAPQYLDLEITERVLVENDAANRSSIEALKARGIYISVDDFGTGFSSLSYLKHFSVDALKIDQLFVRGLPHDKEDAAITSAIISLARGLGINVVAEGIETPEQLAYLKAEGCDRGQGYLFSRPVSAQALLAHIERGVWH
ncbi:MAG: putative bifunctional diguanylate cyclase/phosphodiesterase [Burkholderiaceae bacterium]